MQTNEIQFHVDLDGDGIPERIRWNATDKPGSEEETTAIAIAVWDGAEQSTMRLDLWTKEMPRDDMKGFYINAMAGMAESLEAATGDTAMAQEILALCERLAEMARDDMREGS